MNIILEELKTAKLNIRLSERETENTASK